MQLTQTSVANKVYQSQALLDYYSTHRNKWDDLYPSEQFIFDRLIKRMGFSCTSILDVGCATGGLGWALSEKCQIDRYVGVDINPKMIEFAQQQTHYPVKNNTFLCQDILTSDNSLNLEKFSLVTSLSCIDFNFNVFENLKKCWDYVAPGGYFLCSLRFTNQPTLIDIEKSYVPISFNDSQIKDLNEKAVYSVLNFPEYFGWLKELESTESISFVDAYGYWGAPNKNAVTPFKSVCFTLIVIQKTLESTSITNTKNVQSNCEITLNIPLNLF